MPAYFMRLLCPVRSKFICAVLCCAVAGGCGVVVGVLWWWSDDERDDVFYLSIINYICKLISSSYYILYNCCAWPSPLGKEEGRKNDVEKFITSIFLILIIS